jgi:hypothetical protein
MVKRVSCIKFDFLIVGSTFIMIGKTIPYGLLPLNIILSHNWVFDLIKVWISYPPNQAKGALSFTQTFAIQVIKRLRGFN